MSKTKPLFAFLDPAVVSIPVKIPHPAAGVMGESTIFVDVRTCSITEWSAKVAGGDREIVEHLLVGARETPDGPAAEPEDLARLLDNGPALFALATALGRLMTLGRLGN